MVAAGIITGKEHFAPLVKWYNGEPIILYPRFDSWREHQKHAG